MHPGSVCWLTLPGLESLQAEVGLVGKRPVRLRFYQPAVSPIVHDNILARFRGDGTYRG